MRKPTVEVEWTIVESDTEWERLRQRAAPAVALATHRGRYRNTMALWMTALLCVLVMLGAWGWFSGGSDRRQARQEPTDPVPMAVDKAIADPTALLTNPIDQHIDAAWQAQFRREDELLQRDLRSHELEYQILYQQGDQRLVDLILSTTPGRQRYRQTRFYKRTVAGWRRSVPTVELWGAEQSLETPSFVYHFRQHDAQAVMTVLPQVDALYATMYANFGLPIMPTAEKLNIAVSVTTPPGTSPTQSGSVGYFSVASPAVYLAPLEISDDQLLAQSLVLPLLEQLLTQAIRYHEVKPAWQPMLNGWRLWQMWDLKLPLAAWQQDVVNWLYVDLSTADVGQAVAPPARYPALCAAHKLWMRMPTQIGVPLLCAEPDLEESYLSSWNYLHPPTHLVQLAIPVLPNTYGEPTRATDLVTYPGQTVVLATLIEYTVVAYGRERLPGLVAGLGQYESWATLIPAVYGVSVNEFETGWQTYLVAHYAVGSTTFRR